MTYQHAYLLLLDPSSSNWRPELGGKGEGGVHGTGKDEVDAEQ